jgi:hypothetical protein
MPTLEWAFMNDFAGAVELERLIALTEQGAPGLYSEIAWCAGRRDGFRPVQSLAKQLEIAREWRPELAEELSLELQLNLARLWLEELQRLPDRSLEFRELAGRFMFVPEGSGQQFSLRTMFPAMPRLFESVFRMLVSEKVDEAEALLGVLERGLRNERMASRPAKRSRGHRERV